ncbi:hypothetical protein [Corynebacterium nasicanis]|uniref:Branched-chain amino acid ABC transporter permease n=1 Tax=Corynebacterium nasicanis TaxID=1448267 RepID=A0ABW1QGN5_9CORY
MWLAVLAGLTEGLGAVLVTGDQSLFGPTLLGYAVQYPATEVRWSGVLALGAAAFRRRDLSA